MRGFESHHPQRKSAAMLRVLFECLHRRWRRRGGLGYGRSLRCWHRSVSSGRRHCLPARFGRLRGRISRRRRLPGGPRPMSGGMRMPKAPGMRDRGTGGIADNRAGDGANRPQHHRAGQRAKRGITRAMLVGARLRRNQRQRYGCDCDRLFHPDTLHITRPLLRKCDGKRVQLRQRRAGVKATPRSRFHRD
jgi:hypothetical protein